MLRGTVLGVVVLLGTTAAADVMVFQEGVSPGASTETPATYISQNDPDANYAPADQMVVGTDLDSGGDPATEGRMRGLLHFDLSALVGPPSAEVQSVSLVLHTAAAGQLTHRADLDVGLYMTGAFAEGGATWNNPSGDGDGSDERVGGSGTFLTSTGAFDPTVAGVDILFPYTHVFRDGVQWALDENAGQVDLLLKDQYEPGHSPTIPARSFARFASEDAGTSGHRPELTVEYVPEPATVALTAAGGLATLLRRRRR